jgi:hypothetical protein
MRYPPNSSPSLIRGSAIELSVFLYSFFNKLGVGLWNRTAIQMPSLLWTFWEGLEPPQLAWNLSLEEFSAAILSRPEWTY